MLRWNLNKESAEIKCLKNVHTELLMCKKTNKDENLLIHFLHLMQLPLLLLPTFHLIFFLNQIIEALKWMGDAKSCKKQPTSVQKLKNKTKNSLCRSVTEHFWTWLKFSS